MSKQGLTARRDFIRKSMKVSTEEEGKADLYRR